MLSPRHSSNVTFCTGYWLVADNRKRPPAHYWQYIPKSLRLIAGHNLIVFYEDDHVLRFFEEHAQLYGVTVFGLKVPLLDLPAYPLSAAMLECCRSMEGSKYLSDDPAFRREKGRRRYRREYLQSGPDNYRKIISIWMSKVPLVAEHAIPANPFGSDYFAWIDASVSRFKHFRSNWDFMRLDYEDGVLHHYGSSSYCMGVPLCLNASFLLAHKDIWLCVKRLYDEQVDTALSDAYAHDEETILSRVVEKNKGLFNQIGRNYKGTRRLLYKMTLYLGRTQSIRLLNWGQSGARF